MSLIRTIAILLTTLAVAACSSTPAPEPLDRLNNIVGKVNKIYITRLHAVGSGGAGWHYECFAHGCGGVGQGFLYAPAEISRWLFEDGLVQESEIEGLAIVQGGPDDGDWRAYGAWMDHSAALLSRYGATGANTGFLIASSFGSTSDDPLPVEGSAAWRGAMVGVDVVTAERYAGTANLMATFGEGQRMDVSFTDIANVETGASREDIALSDLAPTGLYDGGRFFGHAGHDDFNQAPVYIDGQLYGPNHTEAAGVFGYNELIGAFGARKQE